MFALSDVMALLPPDYPENLWYVPAVILALLGLMALIDARTGRIPDVPLGLGFLFAVGVSAWHETWWGAGWRVGIAVAAFILLKLFNDLFLHLWRRDAFGMGDVKWTAVAIIPFGLTNLLFAWVLAAWLGLIWLALRYVAGFIWPHLRSEGYIHFAPFLFIALVVKLYVVPVVFPS